MPVFVFTEDAIHEAGSTEEANMTAMERGQRSATGKCGLRQERVPGLLPCVGLGQEILEEIEVNALVGKSSRSRAWHDV